MSQEMSNSEGAEVVRKSPIEFVDAFNIKLKRKPFEQASLLLCDFERCSYEQIVFVTQMLFTDYGSSDIATWSKYIEFCCATFLDKRLQLQRLINKSLEFLDERILADDARYLGVHLHSARLKKSPAEAAHYIEHIVYNRGIGRSHSALYLQWADAQLHAKGSSIDYSAALEVLSMALTNNAKPKLLIEERVKELTQLSSATDALLCGSSDPVLPQIVEVSQHPIFETAAAVLEPSVHPSSLAAKYIDDKLRNFSAKSVLKKSKRTTKTGAAPVITTVAAAPNDPANGESAIGLSVHLGKHAEESMLALDAVGRFNTSGLLNGEPTSTKAPRRSEIATVEAQEVKRVEAANSSHSARAKHVSFCPADQQQSAVIQQQLGSRRFIVDAVDSEYLDYIPPVNMSSKRISSDTSSSSSSRSCASSTNTESGTFHRGISATGGNKISASTVEHLSPMIAQNDTSTAAGASFTSVLHEDSRLIQLNGKQYTRLNVLGKGGSSCVYRIISHHDGEVFAYKRVEVKDGEESDSVLDSYANEIALLKRLNTRDSNPQTGSQSATAWSNRIIDLVDFEINREQRYVAMLLEAGDIDLSKVLNRKNHARSMQLSAQLRRTGAPEGVGSSSHGGAQDHQNTLSVTAVAATEQQLDPFFSRMVWREMLEAVDHIHQHRIVHGDLKPANFVFVKGHLKLIDFGIAKSFSTDTTNIYRDSQIGTINYMAPEAIAPMSATDASHQVDDNDHDHDHCKMRLGRSSDIWSLGCILYQMLYGRPPFSALNTIQKLTTIPNPAHVIRYPEGGDPDAIDSIKACLVFDPRGRSKITGEGGLMSRRYLQIRSVDSPQNAASQLPTVSVAGIDADSAAATNKRMSSNYTATHSASISLTAATAGNNSSGLTSVDTGNCSDPRTVSAVAVEHLGSVVSAIVTALTKRAVEIGVKSATPAISTRSQTRSKSSSSSNGSSTNAAAMKFSKEVSKWLQGMDIEGLQADIQQEVDRLLIYQPKLIDVDPSSALSSSRHPTAAVIAAASSSNENSNFVNSISRYGSSGGSSSSSCGGSSDLPRAPLKTLPVNIQNQILTSNNKRRLQTVEESKERVSKWQKKMTSEESNPQDMRSVLERRIGEMRKFLDVDQDNVTATESMDITGFNEYF